MRYLPHIYEKTIFLLALTMDRSMTAFAPLLLPLLSFLSVLCCYQYQFYNLIFVIEIISKLPYLLSISFLYFHIVIKFMSILPHLLSNSFQYFHICNRDHFNICIFVIEIISKLPHLLSIPLNLLEFMSGSIPFFSSRWSG